MSEKNLQTLVARVYDAVKNVVGIIDSDSIIIACSKPDMIGECFQEFPINKVNELLTFEFNGYVFGRIESDENKNYFAFVKNTDKSALQQIKLITLLFSEVKKYDDKKHDKNNFLKGIILDNILPGDIFLKARELNFNSDVNRVCLLLKVENDTDIMAFEVLSSLFPDKNKDFVINLNENDIAIIKEVGKDVSLDVVEKLAKTLTETLSKKYFIYACVGIGSIVSNIRDLARSFKEAQIAFEIGKVFDTERNVVSYEKLGIARLIYQVPTTICEMFLKEVFKKSSIDALDEETLFTIQKFFENNLNVSETARKLFIHRNTLVYRIEKICKITNLDLRQFDHAILFKVAMMVEKYLRSNPVNF